MGLSIFFVSNQVMSQVRLLAVVMLLLVLLPSCSRSTVSPLKPSPNGSMLLLTAVNQSQADPRKYLCVIVEIQDASDTTLHREVTPASDTQRWTIQWVSDNEILLDSSDVGRYRIHRQPDDTWKGELGAT
ncbi:hypothetical protein [Aeoliella mucimassa]|uniref:Uncharacterized protein n=1 Tax=Aeoliella mucimassa TaxID=2527972 RepID=A0A518AUU8_9BACT|nr:hypothetical protein [Aeoliella mucimassa]QDU58488.1 hypothetical protein Pan181_47250 [Aeoliella mucimassa]